MRAIDTKDLYQLQLLSDMKASPSKQVVSYITTNMHEESDRYKKCIWIRKDAQEYCVDQEDDIVSYLWIDETTLLVQMKYDELHKVTPFRYCCLHDGTISTAFSLPYEVNEMKIKDEHTYLFSADIMVEKQNDDDTIVITQIPFWDNGAGFIAGKRNHLFLYHKDSGETIALLEGNWHVSAFDLQQDEVICIAQNFTTKQKLYDGIYAIHMETREQTEILKQDELRVDQLAVGNHVCYFSASDIQGKNHEKAPDIYAYAPQTGFVKELENEYTLACNIVTDCHVGKSTSFQCVDDQLYFLKTQEHHCQLYTLQNGIERCLSPEKLMVRSFAIADECYVIGMEKAGLEELYIVQDDQFIALTQKHQTLLLECANQVPQELKFSNAEGTTVTGWVVYPKDFDEAKSYPGLLSVHGGPRCTFGDVFHHEMQYFAGQGYFVFYTNPRGSDGYGEAYADLRGKYGDIDYRDLMDFTDQVVQNIPQLNSQKLGVLGGSYGGFMTNWMISHTQRFAAAASQRCVANWVSDFGTSCIGYQFDPNEMKADPWTDMQAMWNHSPLAFADKVKTPTLFLHSLEDYNCPVSEGMQMFTALQYFDIPSRMCLFPGENHELSRSGKPKHRERRLMEMKDWFAHYLK